MQIPQRTIPPMRPEAACSARLCQLVLGELENSDRIVSHDLALHLSRQIEGQVRLAPFFGPRIGQNEVAVQSRFQVRDVWIEYLTSVGIYAIVTLRRSISDMCSGDKLV